VSRRIFILVAVLAAALLVVPTALALRVHVRVEGKTRTIFGASEPSLSVNKNALDALDSASFLGEFYYHVTNTSFGPYVEQIGRYPAGGSSGWVFKVNGVSPPVGADAVTLMPGDHVLWYWATFGPTGGPETLLLQSKRKNCYRVLAQNDAGKTRVARGSVLRVGARSIRTKTGSACIGRHRGPVRATLAGAVRSNVLA
jgi:Domain of unknown function (DUF4430)